MSACPNLLMHRLKKQFKSLSGVMMKEITFEGDFLLLFAEMFSHSHNCMINLFP